MLTAAHYRREAERYRKLATTESDPARKKQMLGFAQDFEVLASLLESGEESEEKGEPPPPAGLMQQQPMQQQQQKKTDDDT